MPPSIPSPEMVEQFLNYLQEKSTPNTVRAYRSDISHFLNWSRTQEEPLDMGKYMSDNPSWTQATTRCRVSRVKKFIEYLRSKNLFNIHIRFSAPKTLHRKARRVLSNDEIELILSFIPARSQRDALLYRLLYRLGLRVSELTALRSRDIRFFPYGACILEVTIVRRAVTTLYLDDRKLTERIYDHIRELDKDDLVFQSTKLCTSTPLRQQTIHKRWVQYTTQANVSCSLEDLRVSGIKEWGKSLRY